VRETSLFLPSACLLVMEFRFDAMLRSNLGNENSDAGHIKFKRAAGSPPWSRESLQNAIRTGQAAAMATRRI